MKLGAYAYVAKPLSYAETLSTAKYFSEPCVTGQPSPNLGSSL